MRRTTVREHSRRTKTGRTRVKKHDRRLDEYRAKRDFRRTPEPTGRKPETPTSGGGGMFVVQEHDARTRHYDFRVEHKGVLKSWALPKGMPTGAEKRLAIETEDHPLEYSGFEGKIPRGDYGAGTVRLWDRGKAEALKWSRDEIVLRLRGEKTTGEYVLVKYAGRMGQWLIFKQHPQNNHGSEDDAQTLLEQRSEERIRRVFESKRRKLGLGEVRLDLEFIDSTPIADENVYGEAFPHERPPRIWLQVFAPDARDDEIERVICDELLHVKHPGREQYSGATMEAETEEWKAEMRSCI